MLKVLILGSAAGGGFPQWNCNCDNCSKIWAEDPDAVARTQSSLAVTVDDENWFLLNASPDLRQQIQMNKELHPKFGKRHSPIVGAILTNADVDHIGGLLTTRESHPLAIYATKRVMGVLGGNSLFNILNPEYVDRRDLPVFETTELQYKDGTPSGIEVELFPVPGKIALYLEDESKGDNFGSVPEDTVGIKISSKKSGKHFYYLPGCSAMPDELKDRVRGAEVVFFDGTTWIDEEMIKTGCGVKTGQRMGHMCMDGPEGSIEAFKDLDVKRKVFIHINNTNPVLLNSSQERKTTIEAGWEIGFDGMEVLL
ncbi:Coenzyme PQQ synthesis protein B [Candidatus Terasakiella magnetica]|uniref:Coenzyme PQQ synthesis protein B n=1 Tax=Candidatus Terasakiella magnetica TaxID=1867952 RepID=A0A1C3RL32_9PROT|nr:pyrroloquinoline quinone biosynthesis protein PqqB [Candidatus Terasakiella magnetica]SCA57965.1 Coenzyme PQQ synthesis protein B [Candidatus Terasakiella magnetica]